MSKNTFGSVTNFARAIIHAEDAIYNNDYAALAAASKEMVGSFSPNSVDQRGPLFSVAKRLITDGRYLDEGIDAAEQLTHAFNYETAVQRYRGDHYFAKEVVELWRDGVDKLSDTSAKAYAAGKAWDVFQSYYPMQHEVMKVFAENMGAVPNVEHRNNMAIKILYRSPSSDEVRKAARQILQDVNELPDVNDQIHSLRLVAKKGGIPYGSALERDVVDQWAAKLAEIRDLKNRNYQIDEACDNYVDDQAAIKKMALKLKEQAMVDSPQSVRPLITTHGLKAHNL